MLIIRFGSNHITPTPPPLSKISFQRVCVCVCMSVCMSVCLSDIRSPLLVSEDRAQTWWGEGSIMYPHLVFIQQQYPPLQFVVQVSYNISVFLRENLYSKSIFGQKMQRVIITEEEREERRQGTKSCER